MKTYLLLTVEPSTVVWPYFLVAIIYPAVIIWVLGRRFNQVMVE
ncbi:hypothetical protein QTO31_06450 [Chloroflexus sp. MS-CIW-1]|nr:MULTISPECIES: hypothetical protein [unclassified Chloroflexus]MDN5271609.1 hypothetical protein [Chloroflexus sp. MS-CIW-1]